MADASEREREASTALQQRLVAAALAEYPSHETYPRAAQKMHARMAEDRQLLDAYRAAVEARVLADVIAVVSSDAHAMTFQTLGQYRTNLLTRLRAMEGHTDG